jgi:hypothetical protein
MRFAWDPGKAAKNVRKHGISFHEAMAVFRDPLSTTFPDEAYSLSEPRFVTIGTSGFNRLLVVAHCDVGDRIRIISARRATRRERMFYEQGEI